MSVRSASRFAWRAALGVVALLLLTVTVAVFGVVVEERAAAKSEDETARYTEDLELVERLRFNAEEEIAASRGYVLNGEPGSLERLHAAAASFGSTLKLLSARAQTSFGVGVVADVGRVYERYEAALDEELNYRDGQTSVELDDHIRPVQDDLRARIQVFVDYKRSALAHVLDAARKDSQRAIDLLLAAALVACFVGAAFGFVLARHLTSLYDAERCAVQQREDVLAIVSHDLRNPLQSILLAAHSLERGAAAPRVLKLAQSVARSASRMERLIHDLLDAAKLNEGARLSVTKDKVDVSRILADVVELFAGAAREKGVALDVEAPPGLAITADADRLTQVMSNLLANALKYTPSGGHVEIGVDDRDRGARFTVSDTGPGIPDDIAAHVFDRFWSKSEGGTGLGLFIARGIVEAHGGHIWVERNASGGSRFAFELPHDA